MMVLPTCKVLGTFSKVSSWETYDIEPVINDAQSLIWFRYTWLHVVASHIHFSLISGFIKLPTNLSTNNCKSALQTELLSNFEILMALKYLFARYHPTYTSQLFSQNNLLSYWALTPLALILLFLAIAVTIQKLCHLTTSITGHGSQSYYIWVTTNHTVNLYRRR